MAKVLAVNISEIKGVPKRSIPEGKFIKDFGLEGDAHGGKWHRQVSLLGIESIKKMKSLKGDKFLSGKFAENLTTEGIILYKLAIGTRLKIGETIQEVTQIGKECHTGCNIRKLSGDCVMPREGIFTRVIKGGSIKPGDEIEIISE